MLSFAYITNVKLSKELYVVSVAVVHLSRILKKQFSIKQ